MFLTEKYVPMLYVTRLARLTIVEAKNESRFDFKLMLKRKDNIYVEGNTTRAFLALS